MSTKQSPAPDGPSPRDLYIIQAGENAFQAGLAKARNRGGPVRDIDALCARPCNAPVLLNGKRLTRMTLGIQRLMQKRAAMPGPMESPEILLYFARGPETALVMQHYSEEDQSWSAPEQRVKYEEMVSDLDLAIDDDEFGPVSEWLSTELRAYGRLMNGDEEDTKKPEAKAGASGSRVGWWLRAVEGICAQYAAACPPGRDLTQWAIWEFPVNDYLALQPAALERNGVELPEHYAIKEARLARSKGKKAAAAQVPNVPSAPADKADRDVPLVEEPVPESPSVYIGPAAHN